MAKHVSGKITQTSTTSGRGLNKRTTISTSETTDVPGVNINTTRTSRSVGDSLSLGGSLLCLIVAILLIVSLFKSLIGSNPITFGGLLETLASAPSVNMSLKSFEIISPIVWEGDFLSILAGFLNIFIIIFNVLVYAFKGLYQVVVYVVWVIKFIFV